MNTITPINEKSWIQKTVLWLAGIIAIGLPLVFDPWCTDAFALPKLTLLRLVSIGIVLLVLFDGKISWRGGRAGLWLGLFAIVLVASTLFSTAPHVAFLGVYGFRIDGLLSWMCYFMVFSFGAIYFDRKILPSLLLLVVIGGWLVSLYAVFQFLGFDPLKWGLDPTRGRVWSSFGNPNFLAAYVAMTLPFGAALLIIGPTKAHRIFAGIGLGLQLWVLIQTVSRAAWLGALVGLAVFLGLSAAWGKIASKKWLLGTLGALVVLGLLAPWSRISERFRTVSTLTSPEWVLRIAGWKAALGLAKEKPILGHGAEGYQLNFRRHIDSSFFRITHETQKSPLLPHNEFLQVLVTAGGVGLLLYVLFLAALGRSALRLRGDPLVAVFAAALIASLVNNLFSFHTVATVALFFFLAGVLAGLSENPKTLPLPGAKTGQLVLASIGILGGAWVAALSLHIYQADRIFKAAAQATDRGFIEIGLKKYQHSLSINKTEPHYLHAFAGIGLRMAQRSQNAQAQRGWLEGTGRLFQSILKLNPADALAHNGLGTIAARLGNGAEAKKQFDLAAKLDPHLTEAWTNLGALYYQEGKMEQAREAYARAKDINPYDPQIYYDIGVMNALDKKWDLAKRSWEEALEVDPHHQGSKQALALLQNKNQGAQQ